ncbi:hypothetical protein D9757_013406 [Collybiopsis confluens]|uniref:Uncharacterized protein n=1 Tax=Collybiopsis confluens TaxID=2823264 RepID=A0A8H5D6L3_9AGAR|nr:hypothetical protein D9757_013406 [Collybiopsis confluens]
MPGGSRPAEVRNQISESRAIPTSLLTTSMAQTPPKYEYDIPALSSLFAALRNIQNTPEFDSSIRKGTNLDIKHLRDAKMAVAATKALRLKQDNNGVTDEVVEAAELRHSVLKSIHATDMFGPGDLLAALTQITNDRFDTIDASLRTIRDDITKLSNNMDDRFNRVDAAYANLRSKAANSKLYSGGNPLQFRLQKTIPGLGTAVVDRLRPASVPANAVLTLPAAPATGSEYEYQVGQIMKFSHAQILNLVYYYNEDFGIIASDSIEDRTGKLIIAHVA